MLTNLKETANDTLSVIAIAVGLGAFAALSYRVFQVVLAFIS